MFRNDQPDETPEVGGALSTTYHTVHSDSDGSLSASVFEAVADALGVDPATTHIPIDEHIDPDKLDTVFKGASGDAYIVFPIWDFYVVVHGDGHIFVHPAEKRR